MKVYILRTNLAMILRSHESKKEAPVLLNISANSK